MNLYEVLGIAPDADVNIIRAAYKTLAARLLKGGGDLDTEKKRRQLEAAMTVLGNPENRSKYDAALLPLRETATGERPIYVEKRVLPRARITRSLHIRLASGSHLIASLVDLSGSGAQIEVQAPLKLGDLIYLTIAEDAEPFAMAAIVRVARQPDRYGLRWVEFDARRLGKGSLARQKY